MNRTIIFSVKGNQYNIDFPTVGQFIQMESRRMILSKGTYRDLISSNMISSFQAYQLIDMVVTLEAICPKLIADLKVDSIEELDLFDSLELLEDYIKVVNPWTNDWRKTLRKKSDIINGISEPEENNEEKENN